MKCRTTIGGIYDRYCLPHVLHVACGTRGFRAQRQKIVPQARGQVLEIGVGSGLNLPFYDRNRVETVWALEPAADMRRKARGQVDDIDLDVRWLDQPAERIELADASMDSIVLTYTLCTIPDWRQALGEMRRVLKPGGRLLFSEHGAAPDPWLLRWQQRFNPIWGALLGGCQLQRPIPALLREGGFSVESLESGYVQAPKLAAFQYWGAAFAD